MKNIQTILILFIFLIINQVSGFSQEEFNKGNVWVQYLTGNKCFMQVQSFTDQVTKPELDSLVSLLLGTSIESRGFEQEFRDIIPLHAGLSYDSLQIKLKESARIDVLNFESTIQRLSAFHCPVVEFDSLKQAFISNYLLRQHYNKIILSFIQTGNTAVYQQQVMSLFSDAVVQKVLNELNNPVTFYEKFFEVPMRIYFDLKEKLFPMAPVQALQARLMDRMQIRMIIDDCED
ncbi:MAG: hypothetical protein ACOYNC_02145 [Bacteroidales bacterium]